MATREWEMFNIVDSADPHSIVDSVNTQRAAEAFAEELAKDKNRPFFVYVETTRITSRKLKTFKP